MSALLDWVNRTVPHDMAALFIYRGAAAPLLLGDSFGDEKSRQGLARYIQGTYVINPFYQAYRNGLEPGIHRMRDLAPDAYLASDVMAPLSVSKKSDEEIGYLTESWPEGQEELEIAIPLPEGAMGEITLSRPAENGGFSADDLAALDTIRPLIFAFIQKHWELLQIQDSAPAPDNRIDLLFEEFGKDILSTREGEVIRMILKGHSSDSTGRVLGISTTTVKTHRKNAYAKLNISSQSELLSLFLISLG